MIKVAPVVLFSARILPRALYSR